MCNRNNTLSHLLFKYINHAKTVVALRVCLYLYIVYKLLC